MTLRIGINGFGRIGRNVLRALYESPVEYDMQVVAINDLGAPESLVHLLRYDTTHGAFSLPVSLRAGCWLCLGEESIPLLQMAEPGQIPWASLGVDVVLECTGHFRAYEDASRHLEAGAKRVILGAVPFDHADAVVVYGINHQEITESQRIISAASCTTHCLGILLSLLDQAFGIEAVMMTEVHAYTSDQHLLDHAHRDLRRARAGAQNLIPTTSSSVAAIQQVLPQLQGRISGYSLRVPTLNVAMLDLVLRFRNLSSVDAVHACLREGAEKRFRGLLGYCTEPLVSVDFNHRMESAIFDATQTAQVGDMLKIAAWYDNEWGYANRLLDLLASLP
ncbi:Glyceraldehyde 3-phosphate dehydrogenase [gamma proteobacterium HdN1]|nr:Glyceraldehyde 3-phosphate dehydrogenase [gamma proteobacterium HdN1]